mmetsp:Transcript_33473/g.87024  ORF Transcript_33473/g.87024 Transcript_33473/m.87024 type:complete len:212 (+) Transcript_33473:287-922(+)
MNVVAIICPRRADGCICTGNLTFNDFGTYIFTYDLRRCLLTWKEVAFPHHDVNVWQRDGPCALARSCVTAKTAKTGDDLQQSRQMIANLTAQRDALKQQVLANAQKIESLEAERSAAASSAPASAPPAAAPKTATSLHVTSRDLTRDPKEQKYGGLPVIHKTTKAGERAQSTQILRAAWQPEAAQQALESVLQVEQDLNAAARSVMALSNQ